MLRWAAGRYQLLVLSRHYLDSSKHVVQYLEKIEEKLSTAKDIPPAVLEKIKEESKRAKVRISYCTHVVVFNTRFHSKTMEKILNCEPVDGNICFFYASER